MISTNRFGAYAHGALDEKLPARRPVAGRACGAPGKDRGTRAEGVAVDGRPVGESPVPENGGAGGVRLAMIFRPDAGLYGRYTVAREPGDHGPVSRGANAVSGGK
jgi:hypothetical protein